MNIMKIVGRTRPLFDADVSAREAELKERIQGSRILVIGGAGTIGQAVVRELFVQAGFPDQVQAVLFEPYEKGSAFLIETLDVS